MELFQYGMDWLLVVAVDNENEEQAEKKYSCSEIHKICEIPNITNINA